MTGATADLGTLLGGLSFDTNTVVQQVAQRVMGQMISDGAFAGATGSSPEEVVASAIGDWLTRTMQPNAAASGAVAAIEATASDLDVEELLARNSDLAAAVGACDCWGDDTTCPYCEGVGTPGWMPPDRRLFAQYVYPAVRSLRTGRHRHRTRATHDNNQKGQMR